jgi:hypothetical protein
MCTARGEGTARRNSASSSSALKRRMVEVLEVLEMLDRWHQMTPFFLLAGFA